MSVSAAAVNSSPVVGRLAPSPTGAQHVGNARTYLIAWLSARSQKGRVVLRIEDIDSPRVKRGAAQAACDDLRWLGMTWDEGPIVQTQRLSHYEKALEQLKARELVYPCTCTRTDVEQAASAPHADHESPIYPGTCSSRRVADAAHITDRTYSWRMRCPDEEISYEDGFLGRVALKLRDIGGDFVLWKSSGTPAYQLAVVVDDAAQGITEVIRANDLVPSTPRQILLYRALGLSIPRFTHVPLVVGLDGRRLAKRHGDTRLAALREAGVRPEALLGLLAWSCRWIDQMEPIRLEDLLARFSLRRLSPDPLVLIPSLLKQIGYDP